eukprot:4969283-Alexandrium_andersonii.AAC.1
MQAGGCVDLVQDLRSCSGQAEANPMETARRSGRAELRPLMLLTRRGGCGVARVSAVLLRPG